MLAAAAPVAAELAQQVTAQKTRGSLELFMECIDEELAPSQREAGRKAESEYQLAVQQMNLAHKAVSGTRSAVSGHRGGRAGTGKQSRRSGASATAAATTHTTRGRGNRGRSNVGRSTATATRAVAPITIAPAPPAIDRGATAAVVSNRRGRGLSLAHRGRGGRGSSARGRGRRSRTSAPAAPGKVTTHSYQLH